eukprot:347764-Chlamydomonas_euryale.AAC.1
MPFGHSPSTTRRKLPQPAGQGGNPRLPASPQGPVPRPGAQPSHKLEGVLYSPGQRRECRARGPAA